MMFYLCRIIAYPSDYRFGGMSPLVAFFPFLLLLIPLLTVDKSYFDRVSKHKLLAALLLLDFKNNPTTAFFFIISFLMFFAFGYAYRYCFFVYNILDKIGAA